MKVYNSTRNVCIGENIEMADNFISRTFGLIPKQLLKSGEGLVIKPCCSIHTFFMRFDIDVVFINKKGKVVAVYSDVKPFRILPIHISSYFVLELCSGEIENKNIQKGDIIQL